MDPAKRITWEELERVVATVTGVEVATLRGRDRRRKVSEARSLLCHLARDNTPMTLQEIALNLGGRDHSTICHLLDKAKRRRKGADHSFRENLYACQTRLQGVPRPSDPQYPQQTVEITRSDPPTVRVYCRFADGSEWACDAVLRRL